jgi:hypothetical protein
MIRTQIYLSEVEHRGLHTLARKTGKTLSELVRSAIDQMLQPTAPNDRLALLRSARGIWQDRTDLPDFAALRRESETRLDTPQR